MRPDYKDVCMLNQRWQTKDLLRWTEETIVTTTQQIQQIHAENKRVYETSKRTHQQERDDYRRAHPRSNLPSRLSRAVVAPPDMLTKWYTLLKRRETEQRKIARQAEEQARQEAEARPRKRETFLKRMDKARYRQRVEREQAIRKLINTTARQQGLKLMEKATDKRLEELLAFILTAQSA